MLLKNNQMKLSIIILNYNSWKFLDQCLSSLAQFINNNEEEVVVIDNNSKDIALFDYQKKYPFIDLISLKQNLGFAGANNMAVKRAKGEVLLFLNPDIIVSNNIFSVLIDAFTNYLNVGIFAPKLVLPDGQPQPWAYGRTINKHQDRGPIGQEVDWVSGAALAIRRSVFEKVGGFDEKFFMYFEDQDLCERVRKTGQQIIILPEQKVVHFGGQSLKTLQKRKELYYQSQNYYWRKKYGAFASLLLRLILWPYKSYILGAVK